MIAVPASDLLKAAARPEAAERPTLGRTFQAPSRTLDRCRMAGELVARALAREIH